MSDRIKAASNGLIKVRETDAGFAAEVMRHSGVNVNKCLHCRTCAGGCPFYPATDYAPNSVIRLVQFGLRKEALECSTIWFCVGCHTCAIQCPQAIDMAALMDSLRHFAIQERVVVAEPDILNFHRDVLHSIKRYGRTHKLEVMLRYKARKWDWFTDMTVGLKMFAKRKLHLLPSRTRNIAVIRKIFEPKPISVAYE